jgi:hypothetical protein
VKYKESYKLLIRELVDRASERDEAISLLKECSKWKMSRELEEKLNDFLQKVMR